jgi:hypothetical protein
MPISAMVVTIVLAALEVLEQITGFGIGWLTEEWISSLIAVLWPILLFLIPGVDWSRAITRGRST